MGPRAGLDGRNICPYRDSIPDRPALSQSLYRLSYPVHLSLKYRFEITGLNSEFLFHSEYGQYRPVVQIAVGWVLQKKTNGF